MIDILYITFNRIAYTRLTLPALIKNAGTTFSLTIVDNGSTDGTVEYLKRIKKKHSPIIRDLILNGSNRGISEPTNKFWKTSKAEFLGKVDNDTLVPENWLARMLAAHDQCERLGVIGGFHFNMKYVDKDALRRRVVTINKFQLVPDAFIGGCCYLFRKSVQEKHGYLTVNPAKKSFGWTEYQKKIFKNGYLNGYLYPLLLVEHFDDPLSQYNLAFTKHLNVSKISMGEKGIGTRQEQLKWYIRDAKRVESGASLAEMGVFLGNCK